MIEIFIRCFCPTKGLILDLFGGSGIVSIVAKENKMNSKCTEIDKDRAEKIQEKLDEPTQVSLFDFGLEAI